MCVIKCFGITQDPITHNYALVLQYMENGDLRSYLKRTVNSLTWKQRIDNIYDICLALNNIHIHKLIHKDLHPGNVFIDSTFAYIGDFGFCMPANEILSNSTQKNDYGVMPYMAPEYSGDRFFRCLKSYLSHVIHHMVNFLIPAKSHNAGQSHVG